MGLAQFLSFRGEIKFTGKGREKGGVRVSEQLVS